MTTEKYGFVFLLTSLIGLMVIPPYWSNDYKTIASSGLASAVMFSFVVLVAQKRFELVIGVLLGLPVLIGNWWGSLSGSDTLHIGFIFFNIIFYVFVVVELLKYLLIKNVVNFNIIAAAVSAYFIIGLMWTYIYCSIETLVPGSFLNESYVASEIFSELLYFSFVTMTTLGYGDITPQSMIAQRWVILQSIVGQFYLAIIIARSVSLYSASESKVSHVSEL